MGRQKGLAAIARHRVIIHLPGGGGRRGSRAWYIRTTPTTTAGAMHSKIDNVHRFREVTVDVLKQRATSPALTQAL